MATKYRIRDWLRTLSPPLFCRTVGNWIWIRPQPHQLSAVMGAGFRRSTVAPGWFYHIGRKWQHGENVVSGRSVRPWNTIPRGTAVTLTDAHALPSKGHRVRFRDWQRELLVVDLLVEDRLLVGAMAEAMLARLERWQMESFAIRGWALPPPVPPDLVARRLGDIDEETLAEAVRWRIEVIQSARAERRLPLAKRRAAFHRELSDVVHDVRRTLAQKARVEVTWLRQCPMEDAAARRKVLLGLLVCPEAGLPAGVPDTVEMLEAMTGPTPRL